MEKDIFNIDKNKLSYGRGICLFLCSIILSGVQKYRKKVLKNGIDTECEEMLQNLAEEYKFRDPGNGGDAGSYPSACGL